MQRFDWRDTEPLAETEPDGSQAAVPAATVTVTLADQDLQALTVALDGVAFLASQQVPIRPPIIATANHAQLLAVTGNAFAPGMGGRDPASIAAISILDGTILAALAGFPAPGIPAGIPFLGIDGPISLAALSFIRAALNVDFVVTGTEVDLIADPISLEASRISTTLHDIWDDFVGGPSHDGNVWVPVAAGCPPALMTCPSATTLVPVPDPSAGPGEEAVAVPFVVIPLGIRAWLLDPVEGPIFTTETFMHGMTRTLRLAGIAGPDLCALYALHTPTGVCDPLWMLP